jgi:phosphohistidine phosphatase
MARQLWLLRHAEAEPHGTRTDAERRLTKRGRLQARAAGVALARMRATFDVVLFSPRVRARQTAELAAEGWSKAQRGRLELYEPLSQGFEAAQALQAVRRLAVDGRLLVVGHEPDLTNTIAALTGARVDLKKGGLAVVRLEGGSGELVVVMRPRELALIAGANAPGRGARQVLPNGVPVGRN